MTTTKMITAVIIDDEPKNAALLKKMLDMYCPQVTICGNANSVENAVAVITKTNPDLLFLDIEISGGNAFHLLDILQPAKFDIIFVANVFHHIPEALHHSTLKQLRELLTPTGFLYVFEHNPKNPLTRRVFETCEFDVGCKMIKPSLFIRMCGNAGYTTIIRNYVLFFPKSVSFLSFLETYLKWCPLGAQYYIKAR